MNATSSVAGLDRTTGKITVLYDERCAFCLRCRDWLASQPCLVEVDLLPAGSEEAFARYGSVPWLREELVVADEAGQVWVGPAAFLVCLWATAKYRSLSFTLARPGFAKHAERVFVHVSKRRGRWSEWLSRRDPDCSYCDDVRTRRGV